MFTLYGLMSFDNCTFNGGGYMYVHTSQHEPQPPEMIKMFDSFAKQHKITINRCFMGKSLWFRIHIIDVIREIQIVHCVMKGVWIDVHVGSETSKYQNTMTLISLVIEENMFSYSGIKVYAYGPTSFGLIKFSNTVAIDTYVYVPPRGGLISTHFENATFTDINRHSIDLQDVIPVRIVNSEFRLRDFAECKVKEGCAVSVRGFAEKPRNIDLARSLFFPSCTDDFWWKCTYVHIKNSMFVGSAGVPGGTINCNAMNLRIINSQFTMTSHNKPAAGGGFLHFVGCELHGEDFTFNASEMPFDTSFVSILMIDAISIYFNNSHIVCPQSWSAVEKTKGYRPVLYDYECGQKCHGDEYTYEAGSMELAGKSAPYRRKKSLIFSHTKPSCIPCPVGAMCEDRIQALPNYWGYKSDIGSVTLVRCSNGYCCQDDKTCEGTDSCNENRTGTLCGKCKSNWTESLFSPECLLTRDCAFGLVLVLYTLCAIAYGVALTAFNYIKDEGPIMFKKLREKVQCMHGKKPLADKRYELETVISKESQKADLNSETKFGTRGVSGNVKDDSMKYIQILFYYVPFLTTLTSNYLTVLDKVQIFGLPCFNPDQICRIFTTNISI